LEFVFFDVGSTLVEQRVDPAVMIASVLRRSRAGTAASDERLHSAMRAMDEVYEREKDDCRTLEDEAAFWERVAAAGVRVLGGGRGDVGPTASALASYEEIYQVRPGMRELLDQVRSAGLRLGIISNWPPSLERLLGHFELGPFEVVACSGILGVTKPDPAIFRWALQTAGVAGEQAAHVGDDRERDYEPARALGMRAIWLAPGMTAGDVGRALGL